MLTSVGRVDGIWEVQNNNKLKETKTELQSARKFFMRTLLTYTSLFKLILIAVILIQVH